MSSLISDGALRRQLRENGVDVGPITDSTRGVYQRKLSSLKDRNHDRPIPAKRKVPPPLSAPPKPVVQVTSGTKRQRVAPKIAGKQVGPTNKRPRLDSFTKQSPRLEPKKELKLYPDLSEYFPDNHSNIPLSTSKPLSASPRGPQCTAPKPNPPTISSHQYSPCTPSSLRIGLHSSDPDSLQSSEESLFSFDSSQSSQSLMSGGDTPESPVLSPEPKEKGLFKIVTDFFGSSVSRLLNVSGSFSSPRRKLSEGANRNGSGSRTPNRMMPSNSNPNSLSAIEEDAEIAEASTDLDVPSSASLRPSKRYDWELESSDVILCKRKDGKLWRLGKGGFGEVFKGLKDAIDEVAVKKIPLENHHRSVIEQFKQEIDMISKLRHRHIVQFYGACIQSQNCYMVTELMESDLFSIMRSPREAERYKWSGVYGKETLIGVASGLNYLHSRKPPVVHRDIKSPNVLVMAGLAKIADVGIARTMGTSDMTAQKGYSMAWAAPEVVYRRRATEKIDIWSLGVIIWEVVSGRLPRPGKLMLPSDSPPYLNSLYLQCVSDDPARRPSALEVTAELRSFQE